MLFYSRVYARIIYKKTKGHIPLVCFVFPIEVPAKEVYWPIFVLCINDNTLTVSITEIFPEVSPELQREDLSTQTR